MRSESEESRANHVRPYDVPFQMIRRQFAWQAIGLTEESRANDVRPYRFTFSKWVNRLLCPVGHLLYKRRLFFWLLS